MPSLFSRSRANSASKKKSSTFLSPDDSIDEFGRVSSRASATHDTPPPPSHSSPKDKKKSADRSQTPGLPLSPFPLPQYPEGAFLPLSLEPPRNRETGEPRPKLHDYGFLSYERHVVLAPEQLARLVDVVTDELSHRGGITSPFIFSTTALDVSYSSVKRLIRAFLDTCDMRSSPSVAKAEAKWRDEARFAGLSELATCLRWGLARVVRISKGQEVRGLIAWEHYLKFRESEAAHRYPSGHFQSFLDGLSSTIQSTVKTVLTLLIRLTANSTSSGHTPPTLSPLFGPLFFGLGPASLAFHHVYVHYLRATNAMEHIILAFIRWQDTPRTGPSGSAAAALGVPARLKDWIKRYPTSLPFLNDPKKDTAPQPRRGARTVRVLNVRRNVRLYSQDLVKTAAQWGSRMSPRTTPGPSNALYASKEWERVSPSTLKLPPKYSESFKKRMNMPPNFHPDCGPGYETITLTTASSTSSYMSTMSSMSSSGASSDKEFMGLGSLGSRQGEDRFRSLTDMKWGEFESMGFGGIGDDNKKLEFDLTESARQERTKKRQTLSWNDFSAAGFSRADTPLSATLQFSSPIVNTVASWPSHKAEISKKLKKAEKSLPHFGWDTEPVVFNEEVIEEAFIDVFCDLTYGSGWMDSERCEDVDRDTNWALVEFKATPTGTTTASGPSDPRTATLMVLFEEFVPLEYRQKLAQSSGSRRRLPSLFTPKAKQWKPAPTLNGRPYEVGHVPRSPSYREVEFEGLLQAGNATKVISATPKPNRVSIISQDLPSTPKSFTFPPIPSRPPVIEAVTITTAAPPSTPPAPRVDNRPRTHPAVESDSPVAVSPMSAKRMSRFRLPAPVPSPSARRKSGIPYSEVVFETRLASYSDDEFNNTNETESVKQRRRQSKDDAWVDILVGNQQRLLGEQDPKRKSLRETHSDPDLASMEVAQVLAAVKNRSPSPPSMMDRVDRDYGLDQHVQGLDIDEIETVPRTSDVTRSTTYSEHGESGDVEEDDDDDEEDDEQEQRQGPNGEEHDELKEAVTKAKMKARRGRPGYFDLHPERRQAPMHSSDIEDEIRAKLARDDSEDEDDTIVLPAAAQVPHAATAAAAGNILISAVTDLKVPMVPEPVLVPPAPPVQPQTDETPESKSPGPQSRTAALIEMYRERERGGATAVPQVVTIPPAPVVSPSSRIPVRPLPKEPVPAAGTTPAAGDQPVPETPLVPTVDDLGRLTPPRYIHGAPLHNVLEEEEEEV